MWNDELVMDWVRQAGEWKQRMREGGAACERKGQKEARRRWEAGSGLHLPCHTNWVTSDS